MRSRSLLLGMAVGLTLTAVLTREAAAGRFTYMGYATSVPDKTTCAITDTFQPSQMSCEYLGGTWHPQTSTGNCQLYQCTTVGSYIYSSTGPIYRGDPIFFEKTSGFSLIGMIAPSAFPQMDGPTLKVHSTLSNSTSITGPTTSTVWHSTADFHMDPLGNCSAVGTFTYDLAYGLVNLSPGVTRHYAMSRNELKGRPVYFRPSSTVNLTTYESKIGTATYSLGAYSVYKAYGQCSEAVADGISLTYGEGNGHIAIPLTAAAGTPSVTTISASIYNSAYSICRYGSAAGMTLPGWSGIDGMGAAWCLGQGGRDGICVSMANAVVNAFSNRPDLRRSAYASGMHSVSNVSGTPDVVARLMSGAL